MTRIARWVCGVIAALCVAAWTAPASAAAQPMSCRIGIYFLSIHDVDTATGTFAADFWMWSLCPDKDAQPLQTMQFLNANKVEGSLESSLQRGDQWWSTRLFSGSFRQDFKLANYPFDDQRLTIQMEEAVLDDRSLIYAADTAQSGIDQSVKAPGWTFSQFRLAAGDTERKTTYGDPELTGASRYASMNLSIKADRVDAANFIKATFPLYIAAFLALISLGFDVVKTELFLGRMGALGTILFAVVLSLASIDQLVGAHQGLYFLDQIHFAVLGVILLATGWSVFAYRAAAAEKIEEEVIRRWDHRVSLALAGVYVLVNILMIGIAANGASSG